MKSINCKVMATGVFLLSTDAGNVMKTYELTQSDTQVKVFIPSDTILYLQDEPHSQ